MTLQPGRSICGGGTGKERTIYSIFNVFGAELLFPGPRTDESDRQRCKTTALEGSLFKETTVTYLNNEGINVCDSWGRLYLIWSF